MAKRTIIYRGSLKSCNYSCSYCPFSKHKSSADELEKDRQNFARFCVSIERRAQSYDIGAVFITPYGEASIHDWYWDGLARLSGIREIDRVGLQTNLSFPVEKCMETFDLSSGKREKLCVWATFHPEMTDADQFASKCHELIKNHVMVCAGAVGVPANIPLLKKLREKLPPAVYLWMNKMDGLKRNYTQEEIKAFSEIDIFFANGIQTPAAAPKMCQDRCFVEADGKMHTCNISKIKALNWYDADEETIFAPWCSQKRCTCYLAYSGRDDYALKNLFGEYPVFRIPRQFKAAFFDLDKTLLEEGQRGGISPMLRQRLIELKEMCPIFFATSMPEDEVKRRLKKETDLFQGGIFASGGSLYIRNHNMVQEKVYPITIDNLSDLQQFAADAKARFKTYKKNGMTYKATLIKSHHGVWNHRECSRMAEFLQKSDCRFFVEKNCLEIVAGDRDKGKAVEEVCGWLGISVKDVLAVGNDKEDEAMQKVCGAYVSF